MIRRTMNKDDEKGDGILEGSKNILFAIIILSAIMFLAPELISTGGCPAGNAVEGTSSCLVEADATTCTEAYGGTPSSGQCLYTPGGDDDDEGVVVKIAGQVESGAKAVLNVAKWVVLAAGIATIAAMRVKPRHMHVQTA